MEDFELYDDDPEICFAQWVIELNYPTLNIEITAKSFKDVGHIELLTKSCLNFPNIQNLSIDDRIYYGNKFPLIQRYLN
jgi:hypothetical protein